MNPGVLSPCNATLSTDVRLDEITYTSKCLLVKAKTVSKKTGAVKKQWPVMVSAYALWENCIAA